MSGKFALVPDHGAGSLPVDRYRAHYENVPPHFSETYSLVRFHFDEGNGEELLPEKAPASWVREVSDPLELGAVWFARAPGDHACAKYEAEDSHNEAMWELVGFEEE